MYLAPSTIPGAGMGIFAGHNDIRKNEFLLLDDGDLVIPAYDMNWHVGHTRYNFLWEEYTWKAASFSGMMEEVENVQKMKACSPGLGAAVNCVLPLVNIKDDYSSRQVGLSGTVINETTISLISPGIGSYTPYHGRRWKAKRDIAAGMELYGNYGQGYFTSRRDYDNVPLKSNYKEIDKLLKKYQSIITNSTSKADDSVTDEQGKVTCVSTSTNSSSTSSFSYSSSACSSSKDDGEWKGDLLIFLQNLNSIWDGSRNMHAIPQTDPPGDSATIDWLLKQNGGTGMQHQNSSIRDPAWLKIHARCMDNIFDGISNISDAGRGAFARRNLYQGDLVAPVPLIHIPNRSIFTIYDADHEKPIHQQLLLNYCWGHNESTLLLCPYGLLTSHINHDSNPNTKVVWAADDQMAHPEWRDESIEVWGTLVTAGLSFNFVALRDINEGEEITVDYGHEWDKAWDEHVQYFGNRIDAHYVPAYELNKLLDLKLQTMDEGDYEKQGLHLFCRKPYLEWSGVVLRDSILVLDSQQKEGKETTKIKRKEYHDWDEHQIFPCRIRQRHTTDDGNTLYFAEIFERSESKLQHKASITQDLVLGILFDLPRDAFYLEDQKYYRHHHQIWSFRHDMRVPDLLFPEVWKNR